MDKDTEEDDYVIVGVNRWTWYDYSGHTYCVMCGRIID